MIKLFHPVGDPTKEELEEYMAYALEGRRRVKEQLNKRKADDEYEDINLSFLNDDGEEVIVWCPESKNADATQNPVRRRLPGTPEYESTVQKPDIGNQKDEVITPEKPISPDPVQIDVVTKELKEQHFTIFYGETGYTYEKIFGEYLKGAKTVVVEDPYIRAQYQIANFLRFCELIVKIGDANRIELITGYDDEHQKSDAETKFSTIEASLKEHNMTFSYTFSSTIHDRQIKLDNGWIIKVGRGFDIYQRPDDWFSIGASDFELRPCLETMVDIYRST